MELKDIEWVKPGAEVFIGFEREGRIRVRFARGYVSYIKGQRVFVQQYNWSLREFYLTNRKGEPQKIVQRGVKDKGLEIVLYKELPEGGELID